MKKFLMISLSILCSMLLSVTFAAAQKNEQTLDKIVVVVNDSVITESELDDKIEQTKKQIIASNSSMPPADVLRKQILEQMINRKLQLQLADQSGIQVTDEQITKAINHIAQQNHMTINQLYQQLKMVGMSPTDYRKELHDEIAIQMLQEHEVGSKITITPQEVNDYMRSKLYQASNNKEYHIEDILIALPEAPTSEQIQDAKKRADALLQKIHNGLRFSDAAMAESAGSKALQGGDLGWRKLAETPSAFADQIINMQVNDIAGPIQTPNGFHLILLAGIRNTHGTALTSKQVQELIYQRKMEEGLQAWSTKIRSEAFINMHPEN